MVPGPPFYCAHVRTNNLGPASGVNLPDSPSAETALCKKAAPLFSAVFAPGLCWQITAPISSSGGMLLPLCPVPGQVLCALEKSRVKTEGGVLNHHLYLFIGRMRGVDQQVALLRLNGRRNPKAQGGARFEPVQPNGLRVAFV